jgi:hypothetical protein
MLAPNPEVNQPTAHQLQRSATEQPSICKSLSTRGNLLGAYLLQRSVTEHTSTWKSHFHMSQHAQNVRGSEEHVWALLYQKVLFPQVTTCLVPIKLWSSKRALLCICLILISHYSPSAYLLRENTTEFSSTCKTNSYKQQLAHYLSVIGERYWALFTFKSQSQKLQEAQ